MLAYLLAARPYWEWQLTALELGVHTLHAAIVAVAMGLARPGSASAPSSQGANWAMVALLVLVVIAVLAFEVWAILQLLRLAWQFIRSWWVQRWPVEGYCKQTPSDSHAEGGKAEPNAMSASAVTSDASASSQSLITMAGPLPAVAGPLLAPRGSYAARYLLDESSVVVKDVPIRPVWPSIRKSGMLEPSLVEPVKPAVDKQPVTSVTWPSLTRKED